MQKKETYHFFAFLNRMKYINRWGLMRNTISENIQEHSLQVAMISHALACIKNKFFNGNLNAELTAVLAIFHDSTETLTGDMPTPIKYYNPDISKAYGSLEDIAKEKLLSMLPNEISDVYSSLFFKTPENKDLWPIVKAADRISAYIKCIEEEKAGNKEFKKAGETILKSIKNLDMPEVTYFLDKFMPSYKLSLDELE